MWRTKSLFLRDVYRGSHAPQQFVSLPFLPLWGGGGVRFARRQAFSSTFSTIIML